MDGAHRPTEKAALHACDRRPAALPIRPKWQSLSRLFNRTERRRNMTMSLDAAAQVMREAMRETVRRHSLWYLVQGGVMVLAGAGLPDSVVVCGRLALGLAPDHQRYRARH